MSVKDQLINWASRKRVDAYRDRAAQNLKLADIERVRDVRERYLKIAHHYLEVGESLEQAAKRNALCRAPSDPPSVPIFLEAPFSLATPDFSPSFNNRLGRNDRASGGAFTHDASQRASRRPSVSKRLITAG